MRAFRPPPMLREDVDGPGIEFHTVGAMRLRRAKLKTLRPHDEATGECEGTGLPVDVAPLDRQELAAPGAR
jgi:hypothetical protein